MGSSGKELSRLGEPGQIANPTLSPDGNYVAVDRNDMKVKNVDLWIEDVKRGTASRFTFDPAEEVTPVWARDGQRIAYRCLKLTTMLMPYTTQGRAAVRVVQDPQEG